MFAPTVLILQEHSLITPAQPQDSNADRDSPVTGEPSPKVNSLSWFYHAVWNVVHIVVIIFIYDIYFVMIIGYLYIALSRKRLWTVRSRHPKLIWLMTEIFWSAFLTQRRLVLPWLQHFDLERFHSSGVKDSEMQIYFSKYLYIMTAYKI